MQLPRIPSFPAAVPAESKALFDREMFALFDPIIDESSIEGLRFAYERVWDRTPMTAEEATKTVPGTRALTIDHYCDEPELVRQIANPYFLRIVSDILETTPDQLEYCAGYLHRQRMLSPWTYKELGWPGWHQDGQPTFNKPKHLNVWIYLDPLTRREGVTQVLLGGCELQRENLRAGRPAGEGKELLYAAQDSPETGVWTEGPTGGGFVWTGFVPHRISPNLSGKGRRLLTYEYIVRDPAKTADTLFRKKTSRAQREAMAAMLPADARYLVDF